MKSKSIFKNFFETFVWKHTPTRHIKYKVIDFAPVNKSIMAYKLPWTKLERFLERTKSRLRVNTAKDIAR